MVILSVFQCLENIFCYTNNGKRFHGKCKFVIVQLEKVIKLKRIAKCGLENKYYNLMQNELIRNI